jgi:beta-fructofuranosidase
MQYSRRTFLRLSGAAAFTPAWGRLSLGADDTPALCRKLADDPLRPQYHLLPAHNWMNDPNGPIFFRGRYHMFHQYNPQSAVWGNMHWAHATSFDLIHWKHEPIAISPTANGPDGEGAFSGSAIVDGETPTVIYTGVARPSSDAEATLRDGHQVWRETQCLAVAQDNALRVWKKLADPVIAAPPAELQVTGFRDPYVWRESGRWMLILGSGTRYQGGAILLYTSPDLRHWTYLHPLVQGPPSGKDSANPVDTGDMWECPDFFPLGDKHVLLISTMGKVRWKVGTYAQQRFTPEKEGVVDWGSYYAAKTMLDREGNRILWGWIPETRPNAELIAAGWAGAMSLPRILSLNLQNGLQTEVSPAANQLHSRRTTVPGTTHADRKKALDSLRVHDLAAELDLRLQPKSDAFTLTLQSEDGAPLAEISCANKSNTRELQVNNIAAPLAGIGSSPVHLHMYLDGSVLEIFANETTSVTARIYRIASGPVRLTLSGDVEILSLDAWQMTPISKNRLTSPLCA